MPVVRSESSSQTLLAAARVASPKMADANWHLFRLCQLLSNEAANAVRNA